MGGGSKRKNTLLALCTIVLCAKTAFLTTGIHGTTAQTVERRWTEVTAISLWHEQEQMIDIGGMVTIFCSYGRLKEHK